MGLSQPIYFSFSSSRAGWRETGKLWQTRENTSHQQKDLVTNPLGWSLPMLPDLIFPYKPQTPIFM